MKPTPATPAEIVREDIRRGNEPVKALDLEADAKRLKWKKREQTTADDEPGEAA